MACLLGRCWSVFDHHESWAVKCQLPRFALHPFTLVTQNFIQDLRAAQNKEQEQRRVEKELAKIRERFLDDRSLSGRYALAPVHLARVKSSGRVSLPGTVPSLFNLRAILLKGTALACQHEWFAARCKFIQCSNDCCRL
jgi:hypothetical protein